MRVTKSIEEVNWVETKNGNKLWKYAMRLEMRKVIVAFDDYDGNPDELMGCTNITGCLVFDIKLGEK